MRARRLFVVAIAAIGLFGITPGAARAGGFELPGAGATAMGRGGAYAARADGPMAILFNPANLAATSGFQLHVTGGIGWFDACYQRQSGTNDYTTGATVSSNYFYTLFDPDTSGVPGDGWLSTPYPRVCNAGGPGPMLQLAFSGRLTEEIGIGIGITTPTGVGHSQFADSASNFTVNGGPAGVLPPPNRYSLLSQNQLLLFPTVAIGWSPIDWLRLGLALQWGIAAVNFHTMTRPTAGEDAVTDVTAELNAVDAFVPGATVSVQVVPIDELDIMASFHIQDDISAGQTTTLTYGQYGLGAGTVDTSIPSAQKLGEGSVTAGQPWQVAMGFRYANRITPRPRDPDEIERLSGRIEDAMANEWFDIELDVVYEINLRVTDYVLNLPPDATLDTADVIGGSVTNMTLPLPDRIVVPHRWNDQWSLRLGGDFNVIPGMLSVRAGAFYETSAYDSSAVFSNSNAKQFVGLDFIPGQRLGLTAGLTVRLGRFDVALAYMHVFQETVKVSTSEQCLEQIHADDTDPDAFDCSLATNAGVYDVDFDALSLGVTWHI